MATTQTFSGQVGTTRDALGDYVPYREWNRLGRTGCASRTDLAPACMENKAQKLPCLCQCAPALDFMPGWNLD